MSPRRPAGFEVVFLREAPNDCLPGGFCVGTPDELRLLELCVQSLSACMGVRLCRSTHYTFRTTIGDGAAALVQIATTQSCCTGGLPLFCHNSCAPTGKHWPENQTCARGEILSEMLDTKRPVTCTTASVLLTSLC